PPRAATRGGTEPEPSSEALAAEDDRPLTDGGLPERTFAWPGSARAAVSLTYDDGLASHVDVVGPALQKHHLHATFFIARNASAVHDRMGKWADLYRQGNEIASHTMNHPCDAAQSWVRPGYGLQDYDQARMEKELQENIAQLKALGKTSGPYTFAYPCGITW